MRKPYLRASILLALAVASELALYFLNKEFMFMYLVAVISGMVFVLWVTPVYNYLVLLLTGKVYFKFGNYLMLLFMLWIASLAITPEYGILFNSLVVTVFFLFFVLFFLLAIYIQSNYFPHKEDNKVIVSKLNEQDKE